MGVPAIFAGQRTKLLTSKGLLLKDGTTIDNDGVPNFIRNYCGAIGTTGWVEGSYTAASRPSGNFTASSGAGAFAISTTTTTPLGTGTTSFLLTKSSGASRQGRAVETSFALPLSYRAKVLKIEADYIVNSGTFVAGSNTTDSSLIWYCAFSTDGGSTYTVAEPSSFKLLSNSTTISDKFSASIQTPSNATNMKLIAYVAEAANSAWVVETIVSVSPSQYVYGTPIKGLAPYTASLSYAGTVATNISSQTYRWAQTGDRLSIEGTIIFNGAANANGVFRIPLPPGLIVDTSKTSGAFQKLNGTVSFFQNSGSKFYGLGLPILDGATNGGANNYFLVNSVTYNGLSVQQWQGSTTGISNNPTGAALAAGDTLEFSISDIPILGWSSSVQVSDGYDGRVVACSRGANGQSIPTNIYTPINYTTVISTDTVSGWTDGVGYNSTTGTYTTDPSYVIKTSGKYKITANILFAQIAFGVGNILDFGIYRNGTGVLTEATTVQTTTSGYYGVKTEGIVDLIAGDVIVTKGFQNSGSNKSLLASGSASKFSIEKLVGSPVTSATEEFSERYTNASGQSIPNGGTPTLVTGWARTYSSHNTFNPTTGVFTPGIAGRFRFSLNMLMNAASFTSGSVIYASLYKNGSEYSRIAFYPQQTTGTNYIPLIGSDTVDLIGTDTIDVRIAHGESVARSLIVSASYNHLRIEKVK